MGARFAAPRITHAGLIEENMNAILRKAVVTAAAAWPLASPAGGIYMYEIGTSDLGFAAAGTAARAEDASTLFANRRE